MSSYFKQKLFDHFVTNSIRVGLFNGILATVIFIYFHRNDITLNYSQPWLAAMISVSLFRFALAKYVKKHINTVSIQPFYTSLVLSVAATGTLWGFIYWVNFFNLDISQLMFLLLVMAATGAGGLISLAASPVSFLLNILPACLSIIIRNFQSPTSASIFANILITTFLLFLITSYHTNRKMLLENIRLLQKQKRLISNLKKANRKLNTASITDSLTQIANRRYFTQRMESDWARAVRSSTPITLLMIDVDYFKQYNDNYGHIKGDECLRQVARVLGKTISRNTDLVARIGGDEFAVILYNTSEPEGHNILNKIQAAINQLKIEHKYSQTAAYVTLSIGQATITPLPHENSVSLVMQADNELYACKRSRTCSFE